MREHVLADDVAGLTTAGETVQLQPTPQTVGEDGETHESMVPHPAGRTRTAPPAGPTGRRADADGGTTAVRRAKDGRTTEVGSGGSRTARPSTTPLAASATTTDRTSVGIRTVRQHDRGGRIVGGELDQRVGDVDVSRRGAVAVHLLREQHDHGRVSRSDDHVTQRDRHLGARGRPTGPDRTHRRQRPRGHPRAAAPAPPSPGRARHRCRRLLRHGRTERVADAHVLRGRSGRLGIGPRPHTADPTAVPFGPGREEHAPARDDPDDRGTTTASTTATVPVPVLLAVAPPAPAVR